ncbi:MULTISPECIES: ATP-binding protein [unclassified Agrococcus]|uniref:ATP-binding protein n=1 Tax=unclassified Agrococcus TaxID=2615065 RepID=UPI003617FECA
MTRATALRGLLARPNASPRALTLRRQLVLLQSAIMLVVILGAGLAAVVVQERQIRDAYRDRMIGVASSVAQLPSVLDAFDDADPARTIQPIAELIRTSSDVTYVVVTDLEGVRYSHPNPELIGEIASTPPIAAQTGDVWIGTETGTLGESWRVKVPIVDADGQVVGQVSVGTLESELQEDLFGATRWLALCLAIAALVGLLLSTWAAGVVRRRIHGVEPDEIKAMLETRDATLHGIREGIVVVGDDGRIVLCNDAAARLLDVDVDDAVGEAFEGVLDADLAGLRDDDGQRLVLAGERVLVAHADPVVVHERTVGTVVILVDRTETDDALRALAGAQSAAEGLRAQRHEFANTLHTIGGLIELGETDAALAMVRREGDGGAISGVEESGIHDLELAALVLAKRARARELGVRLSVDAGRLAAPFAVEGADLVTVVGNLVDNALEATGMQGRVHVTLESCDGDASQGRIVVEDDGPGVPVGERGAIFELGHSTKGDGRARGYGLTLVRRVVRRLGGEVEVDDAALGGARVTVTLPVQTRADAQVRR